MESNKPQLLPAEKKREVAEGPGGAGVAARSTAAIASSRRDLQELSQSFSASGDSIDGSDPDPPEHVMLELFCGTCTVSQVRSIFIRALYVSQQSVAAIQLLTNCCFI